MSVATAAQATPQTTARVGVKLLASKAAEVAVKTARTAIRLFSKRFMVSVSHFLVLLRPIRERGRMVR